MDVTTAALQFDCSHSGISSTEIQHLSFRLASTVSELAAARHDHRYTNPSSFMFTPFDDTIRQKVHTLAAHYNPDLVIVIGIGGSSLGMQAVAQALESQRCNHVKYHVADTIDDTGLATLERITTGALNEGKKVVGVVISKSGTTLETLINASFFIQLLTKHKQDLAQTLIIISDAGSPLEEFAQAHSIPTLCIPTTVGGRYSVFTAAGLLPLTLVGIDIDALCAGAQSYIPEDATSSAAITYAHYQQGRPINDLFLFSPALSGIGAWYRQLVGESLGKETTAQPTTKQGITPTVSIGTTDLHSVAQLYLSGPQDKFTTFVYQLTSNSPTIPLITDLTPSLLRDQTVASVKQAIFQGVTAAYIEKERPFCVIELAALNAHVIGELLYAKMIEIVYLGTLLDVNPFNQPQVELYKKKTYQILTKGLQ